MTKEGGRFFEEWITNFHASPEGGERKFCEQFIREHKNLPSASRKPYFKVVLRKADGFCVVLICWTPEGRTRPHRHGGSGAKIHVLQGALEQDLFAVWDKGCGLLERVIHLEGEEFCEDPETVHRIGNASPFDWAVSLHLFEPPLEEMEVFDFAYNERWIVKGDEDTMGKPPRNARLIWKNEVASNN